MDSDGSFAISRVQWGFEAKIQLDAAKRKNRYYLYIIWNAISCPFNVVFLVFHCLFSLYSWGFYVISSIHWVGCDNFASRERSCTLSTSMMINGRGRGREKGRKSLLCSLQYHCECCVFGFAVYACD